MPIDHEYHTGIRRDENHVWRRISDGAEVELDGWQPGDPDSDREMNFMYWNFYNKTSLKNTINNFLERWSENPFICEY